MFKAENRNAKRRLISGRESVMIRRTIFTLALLTICALIAVSGSGLIKATTAGGQEGGAGKAAQQQNNGQGDNSQAGEKALKKRPIVMTIVTKGSNYESKTQYKVGDKILVEVTMTNTGTEPLEVSIGNSYFQDRPRLKKDGKPVLYRQELPAKLREKEKYPGPFGSTRFYKLEPNIPQVVHRFLLEDWYEQLEPGQYEFTLRHRFWGKDVPVDSNTVKFEVDQ